MGNSLISTRWFPTCDFSARKGVFADNVFTNFEQQAEQLEGHDQSYIQLSQGAFQGRFLSASLGDIVAIHMEYCNQALEQEITGSPDHFTFGVMLNENNPFVINGVSLNRANLFVLPPSGNLHVINPNYG